MTEIIKLEFTRIGQQGIVSWDTAQNRKGIFTLPWQDNVEWSAVYQALKLFSEDSKRSVPSGEVRQKAFEKGLCDESGIPRPERLQILGQELYDAIFVTSDLEQAFREAIRLAKNPTVVFHFADEGSYLQTYPWEIMHDGEDFLFKSRASIVRHVDFQGYITPIELKNQLPVLLVDPRPALPPQYDRLPLLDRQVLREQLGQNSLLSPVILDDEQNQLSFERFLTDLSNYHNQTKIIHIDTHGDYGRICDTCNRLVSGSVCQNPECGMPADTSKPLQGHLAFEHANGFEWISAERLGEVFAHRNITLVVITACSSALTGQGTAFNSVAGSLIKHGIPAVVAMQFPVEDQSIQQFVQHFYQILVRDKHLSSAVQIARASIQRIDDAWYRPSVYLRTNPENMLGRLFYTPQDWVEEHASRFKNDLLILEEDSEAKTSKITDILGKQPIIEEIGYGRYMERHALVKDVLTEIDNIDVSNSGLSIFWIHGRSGSGKSVLLLQVIRQLVQQQKGEVIWLKSESRALIDLLKIWVENPPPLDIRWFVAIDDLYAPGRLDQYQLEQISSIIISNPSIQFPTLLTCSPTNQLENFANDIDESFIVRWEMPLINKDEARELQQWYTNTTGKKPQIIGEAFEQNEGLILSMMIEMHEGEIKQYAKRFAKRIESASLATALIPILTLNRLYIYPPKSWLNDDQYDALRRFNRQADFAIEAGGISGNQDGIRLRHPHLSNAFYLALRRHDDVIVHTRDLTDAFKRIFRDAPYLIKDLFRGFVQLPDRLDVIDTVMLAQNVADIWNEQYANILLPLSDSLFAWLTLLQWGGTEPQIILRLREHPADVLLIMLEQHDDLRIWSIIWQNSFNELLDENRRAKYISLGMRWLPDHMQQAGWSFVWERLFNIAFAPDALELRASLIETGILWLRKNTELQDWNYVWQRLADYAFGEDNLDILPILTIGSNWIKQHPENKGWAFVFQKILVYAPKYEDFEDTSEIITYGIDWLTNYPVTAEWSFVYRAIVQELGEEPIVLLSQLKEKYFHLLSQEHELTQWSVLVSILNTGIKLTQKEKIQGYNLALKFLEDQFNATTEWSITFSGVCEFASSRYFASVDKLASLGKNWLQKFGTTKQWPFVYTSLLNIMQRTKYVETEWMADAGIAWLKTNSDIESWPIIFGRLAEKQAKFQQEQQLTLINIGIDWLLTSGDEARWVNVFEKLGKLISAITKDTQRHFAMKGKAIQEITNIAISWLNTRRDKRSWGRVYKSITQLSQHLSEVEQRSLVEIGMNYLEENNIFSEMWRKVFMGITNIGHQLGDSEKKTLIDAAKREMQYYSISEMDYTNNIYRMLLQYGSNSFFNEPEQAWLIGIGKEWLTKNPYMPSWDFLYNHLFRRAEWISNGDINWLIETGLKWLNKHIDADTWPYVFRSVECYKNHSGQSIDTELWRLGARWRSEREWKMSSSNANFYKKLQQMVDEVMAKLGDELFEVGLPFKVGDRVRAVVTDIKKFGAFVTANGKSGLIHISEIAHHRVDHPSDALNVGDSVEVQVISINEKKNHIGFSRKAVIFDPWQDFLSKSKVGDMVMGIVTNTVDYGAFILLDIGIEGLLHKNEMTTLGDGKPQEYLNKGDKVQVMILAIDEEKRRVAFTLDKLHDSENHEQ